MIRSSNTSPELVHKCDQYFIKQALAFWCALFVLFLLRLYWLIKQGHFGQARFPDEMNYYLNGAELFSQQGVTFFLNERSLWNAPFSVIWVWLFGSNIVLIQCVNLFLVIFASYLIWDLARRFFSYKLAWLTIIFNVYYWPFTDFSASLLSEAPTCFFLVLSVWLLVVRQYNFAAGLILGVATLFRPTTQFYPLFLLIMTPFCQRLKLKTVLVLILGFAILVGPYVLKNYLVFGKLSIANGSGAVMHLGSDIRINGNEPLYTGLTFDTAKISKPFTHLDSEGDQRLKKAAWHNIISNPIDTLLLYTEKALRILFGSSSAIFYPATSLNSVGGSWFYRSQNYVLPVFLQAFVMLGFLLAFFSKSTHKLVSAKYLVLYFVAVHSILFAIPRMLMPVYPLAILLSLDVFRSKKYFFFNTVLAGLITFWLCFQFYFLNPSVVSKKYKNAFATEQALSFASKTTNKSFVYSFKPSESIDLVANQVLVFNMDCENKSVAKFSWNKLKSIKINLNKGSAFYRISPSLNINWQGELQEFKMKTSLGCSLAEVWLLR